MTQARASAIIVNEEHQILLIRRIKLGSEYYVLPGGGIEDYENPKTAAVREVKEETSLNILINNEPIIYQDSSDGRTHYIFKVRSYSGKLELGGTESQRNNPDNKYDLEWVNFEKINLIKMYPEQIINMVYNSLPRP